MIIGHPPGSSKAAELCRTIAFVGGNHAPKRGPTLLKLFEETNEADSFSKEVIQMSQNKTRHPTMITLINYCRKEGQLTYRIAIYVPDHAPL